LDLLNCMVIDPENGRPAARAECGPLSITPSKWVCMRETRVTDWRSDEAQSYVPPDPWKRHRWGFLRCGGVPVEKISKTLEEWKQMLDPVQYTVWRLKASE